MNANGNGTWRNYAAIGGIATGTVLVTTIAWRSATWLVHVHDHMVTGDSLMEPAKLHFRVDNPEHLTTLDRDDLRRVKDLDRMVKYMLRRQGIDPQHAIEMERLREPRGEGE